MAGMLDLRDVFQLVIDGLDDRAFTQQQLVKSPEATGRPQSSDWRAPVPVRDEVYTECSCMRHDLEGYWLP